MRSIISHEFARRELVRLGAAGLAALAPVATNLASGQPATPPANADELAAWDALLDQVKQVGRDLLSTARSDDPVTRAEELRYVARMLGRSITNAMAGAEMQPLMRLNSNDISKAGLDASECKYTFSRLDPTGTYRLWGVIGSAHYISFQLIGLPSPTWDKVSGGQSINQFGLKPDADGAFELMIAPGQPKDWQGPWLKASEHDNSVFGREYFDNWENTKPSRFYIERLDRVSQPPLTADDAVSICQVIAKDFSTQLRLWQSIVDHIATGDTNKILPPRSEHASGGQDELAYCQGSFRLGPAEALIVEMDAPDARSWSAQLGNMWWESLDYVNHLASLTAHYAVPSADGRYRVIIARNDPGVVNWLDTTGHLEGTILFRFFLPKTTPTLETRKVAFVELRKALPPDTKRVTPDERATAINVRRRHAAMRWAP